MTNGSMQMTCRPSSVVDPANDEWRAANVPTIESIDLGSGTGSAAEIVLQTLAEKIQQQQAQIARLQADLQCTRQESVNLVLGQLRLREAVLLYVGQDVEKFEQDIAQECGDFVARAVVNSLFVLNRAPVPDEVREAIRAATDHGMRRW